MFYRFMILDNHECASGDIHQMQRSEEDLSVCTILLKKS